MLNYTQTPNASTIVPFIPTQEQTLETLTFRKAVIKTGSTDNLADGIVCGQACTVDLIYGETPVTSKDLAHLFTEIMNSDEPEAFNVGIIIGLVDALLCARKTYPRGW